jgi:CBS domain-containing protein
MPNMKPVYDVPLSEVMAEKPYTIAPPMSLGEVAELFVKYRISGAPVVDSADRVISVMGEGLLLRLAAKYGLQALVLNCIGDLPPTKDLITLGRDNTFTEAYRIFLKHNIHRIPIVDSNGLLLGLVSRSSILKLFVEAHYGKKIPPVR